MNDNGESNELWTKVCPRCSVQSQTSDSFCPRCGGSYASGAGRSTVGKWIAIGVAAAVILGAIGVGISLKISNNEKIKQAEGTSADGGLPEPEQTGPQDDGSMDSVHLDPATVRNIVSGLYLAAGRQVETTDASGRDLPVCELFWNVLNATLRQGSVGEEVTAKMAASSTNSTSGLARNLADWTGDDPSVDALLTACGDIWVGRELVGPG